MKHKRRNTDKAPWRRVLKSIALIALSTCFLVVSAIVANASPFGTVMIRGSRWAPEWTQRYTHPKQSRCHKQRDPWISVKHLGQDRRGVAVRRARSALGVRYD